MERQKVYEKHIVPLLKIMEQYLQQADIPYVFAFAPDGLNDMESAIVAHTSLPPEGSSGMAFMVTFDDEKQDYTVDIAVVPGDKEYDTNLRDISNMMDGATLTGASFSSQTVQFDGQAVQFGGQDVPLSVDPDDYPLDGTVVESGD